MNPTQRLINDHIHGKSIEEVSRLFFPKYWESKAVEEAARDAILVEALTAHDRLPCMSYLED